MQPNLSILTPAIWRRRDKAHALADQIAKQSAHFPGQVEHVVLFDNRAVSIGLKRQACLDASHGRYVAFCDDDDEIVDNYVASLLQGIAAKPDVITFQQTAHVDDDTSTVIFNLKNQDGPFNPDGETLRSAWHVCAWRRDLVADCIFPDSSYGEDRVWCEQARQRVRNQLHLPKILHTYRHSSTETAAPVPT